MSLSITVGGGPPWGLRVSHDEELRPVVAKLIPCGRADSAGVRIGDHIEEVNGIPVSSPNQAHGLIQETKGELRLKVGRSSAGYHATVAREKLSSSLHSSPVNDRKFFNSSVQPRTNPNFRQIRLDVQGVKGSADNKRRMFEQLSSGKPPPPATDRLLQRKIQMGFHAGLPSESTTGYGSVGGDFAGGSGRTTPMSSILAEEDEEADRTLHDDGLRLQNNGQGEGMHPNEMRIASPGPSQWAMRTESHSVAPADGSVEVPRPRGVAALRQAITEKLEMKSPSGASPTTEGRRTPSSWANVKVYEGIEEDPSKPVFGRVLDGPVNPEKYFQGVPPPSYNWVPHASSSHAPAPTSPVQSKPPPFVPPKPPKPSVDLSPEADINGNRKENGRNSFLNSMAAREVEESPSEDYGYRGNYYDNSYGRGSTLTEDSSMTRSTTATEVEQPADPASVEPPEDPTASLAPTNTWPTRGSMDLESSQLLKSKSPSPYSSSSADHYATIRRAPTPVQLEVTSPAAPAQKQYSSSTTNDSGYGDALSPRSTLAFDTFSTVSTMPASSADQTIDTLSIDSPRPERPESLLSYSTVEGGNEQEIAPLRPVSNDPEMTNWYRDMFKKMHRLDPVDPGRPHNGSPSAASTISRPLTPTTLVSRPPSRFECEITPRRARSVGRVVEPADRAAWERSRTVHFHLPSYAFRDEDPRAIVCGGGGCSANGCMRCGRPRKAPSWGEIDYLYRTLGSTVINKEANEERLQSRIARRAISDRLDETARELEIFIAQLSGQRHEKEESPAPSGLADEIAELKRISKEEMMVRQKAERLQEELEEQRQRRHGYLPSAAPALQKNTDRFEGLINDYSKEASPSRQMRTEANNVQTATAVYKFVPKSSREMPLNKGDVVRVHRQIDSNWLEGERNGRSGIFPASYVQMNSEADPRLRMKAVYPFTARNSNEMSLKLGEVITWRREIDANWAEGANHIGEIGIFPKCYVRPLEEDTEAPTVIPARPKTPKITFEMDRQEEEWKPKAREPVEHSVPVHVQQSTYQPAQPAYEPQHEPYQSRVHQPISQQPAYEPQSTYQPPLQHHISHQPEHEPYQPRVQPMALSQPAGRHPAFSEDEPVAIHGASNGYHSTRVEQGRVEQPQINGYHDRHEEFQTNSISATQPYQTGPSSQRPPSTVPTTPNAAGSSLASMIPKGSEVYRANFAYHPEKEDELELRIDDIIFVVEKCDDGWFIGTSLRNGRFGTFPGNYVVRH